ncbi:MAG: hypothetical protein Kow0077_03520 [Anaerolineae bacterium]
MGIRLDWEIENEPVITGAGEPPDAIRVRQRQRRRVVVMVVLVMALVGGVIGGILARLRYVDAELARQLRDTVAVEVAALRIGDIAAYLNIQRSESDAWMLGQTDLYWQYQALKQQYDVDLSGEVLDLVIDGNRGRVLVQEQINGQPFQRLWFYWRFEDGWRHVPRDVTFWGEARTQEGPGFVVAYQAVDESLAAALTPAIARLWGGACNWLACDQPLPPLTVRIEPDPAVMVSWSPDETGVLRVASPLVDRMPADTPLPPELARDIADLLAERVLEHVRPGYSPVTATDAVFIHQAVVDWLIGHFLGDPGVLGSSFVQSLVQAYGTRAAAMLARDVPPDASVAVLARLFAMPLNELRADWREFFQWRLALEPFLLATDHPAALLALYDELAQPEAVRLVNTPGAENLPVLQVERVVVGPGADGAARAWVVVRYPDGSSGPITFRLVDGDWRRSIPDPAFEAVDAASAAN